MPHLRKLHRLEWLTIGYTAITAQGTEVLGSPASLRFLDLRETAVTGKALIALGRLERLEVLILSGTRVAEEGLGQLEGFPRLESLNLGDTAVTDSDLDGLCELKSLVRIDLRGTQITDDGVHRLAALPKLVEVSCEDTAVTPSAISELRATLRSPPATPEPFEVAGPLIEITPRVVLHFENAALRRRDCR